MRPPANYVPTLPSVVPLAMVLPPLVCSCCFSFCQWCGNAKDQSVPLEERLMEFAREKWGNSAYHLMMQSFLCDPRFELCRPGLVVGASMRPQLLTKNTCCGARDKGISLLGPKKTHDDATVGTNRLFSSAPNVKGALCTATS